MKNPMKIPASMLNIDTLPWPSLLDSGINSKKTTYIITPEAKANALPKKVSEIPPKYIPNIAPNAVGIAVINAYIKILVFFSPAATSGDTTAKDRKSVV